MDAYRLHDKMVLLSSPAKMKNAGSMVEAPCAGIEPAFLQSGHAIVNDACLLHQREM